MQTLVTRVLVPRTPRLSMPHMASLVSLLSHLDHLLGRLRRSGAYSASVTSSQFPPSFPQGRDIPGLKEGTQQKTRAEWLKEGRSKPQTQCCPCQDPGLLCRSS